MKKQMTISPEIKKYTHLQMDFVIGDAFTNKPNLYHTTQLKVCMQDDSTKTKQIYKNIDELPGIPAPILEYCR